MRYGIYRYAIFPLIAVIGSLLFTKCTDQIAGSEVTNEQACVYMPDGKTPAPSASVAVVPVDYIPDQSSSKPFETTTDKNGIYTINRIPKGLYNIIAEKGTLSSFQDSIYLGSNSGLKDDTLETPGSLTARILVQPNHNPQSAVIHALGTPYFTNVDTSGWFTLPQFAAGSYQLLVTMSGPTGLNYTDTYCNITIRSGKSDTLDTPIEIIYTGIPVVSGLKAEYNPLSNVVALSWDKVKYSNFYDYLIFWGSTVPADTGMHQFPSSTKDTFFFDTLSRLKIDTSVTSLIGLRYQIAVRTKEITKVGEKSNVLDITLIFSKKTGVLLSSDTMAFVPNTPFKLSIVTDEALGKISHYYYKIDSTASFKEFSGPDTNITITAPGDSVINNLSCIVKVITSQELNVLDTLYLQSRMAWEKVASPFDPNVTGFYSVVYNSKFLVFTENGPGKSVSLWNSSDGTVWKKLIDSLPFTSLNKPPLVFNNKLLILDRNLSFRCATLWSSGDGLVWDAKQIDSLPNNGYKDDYEVWCTYGNRIVIVNYFPDCLADGCVSGFSNSWSSDDGINWSSYSLPGSLFPDRKDNPNKNYVACELNGNLYIGGAWRPLYLISPVSDAYYFNVWNQPQSNPVRKVLFPSPKDQSMIGAYNPQIVVYKGELYMSAQVNMESSINVTSNTKYLWKLMQDDKWVLCSDTLPVVNSSAMKSNYHTLCSFNDHLYSISNSGVWRVKN
jgi:hypothetical protein